MKRIVIILLAIAPFFSYAQEIIFPLNQDSIVEYTEVMPVDSVAATILYSRSKLFITNAFVSGKEVTQLIDDDTKNIIAKGLIPVKIPVGIGYPIKGNVNLTVNIQSKDGRYKYSFTDFVLKYQMGTLTREVSVTISNGKLKGLPKKSTLSVKKQVHESVLALIALLKKDMSGKFAEKDW